MTFTMSKPRTCSPFSSYDSPDASSFAAGRILILTLDVKKTSGFDWYLFDHFKAYMRTWSRVNKFKATISYAPPPPSFLHVLN